MPNRVCSILVKLTLLSLLIIATAATGCSSGGGGTTRTTGGTTSFTGTTGTTGGAINSAGGMTSPTGGTTGTTGGSTGIIGGGTASSGVTGTTGGTTSLITGESGTTGTPDAATDAAVSDTGSALDGAGSGVIYSGVVLARTTQSGTTSSSCGAFVDLTSEYPFYLDSCPGLGPSAGSCCCMIGMSTPMPIQPPDGATVTLTSADGASTLATLLPSTPTSTTTTIGLQMYGTWDLGRWGAVVPGCYAPVGSQPWNPGDALRVSATGNQVHAFSGTLQTGSLLSGVTPSIGSAPLVIDHSQNFEVSWTPEGRENESVLLRLGAAPDVCYCTVPDSDAKVTVDSSLLSPGGTSTISLERLVISTASSDNATITLIGAVELSGEVTFQ
jgi:hypothetical protein